MLVLICHPQTELQEQTIWIGNESSQLSLAGRRDADDLAWHDRIKNDRAYVAPQDHIQEFARIVLENPFETIDAFTDRSMGVLTGRSYRETLAEFPRRNWLGWQRSYWTAPPDGESLFDISDRVLTAFRARVLPVEAAETVAIVCSADVMRVLIGYLTRIEETEIPKIAIETTIPYVVNGEVRSTSS